MRMADTARAQEAVDSGTVVSGAVDSGLWRGLWGRKRPWKGSTLEQHKGRALDAARNQEVTQGSQR